MFLERINYLKTIEYLKTSDMIMIPVGSLENHGKHLPLGTDTLIPEKIAELINERSDVLIAPAVPYGATDDLTGFPGTVSLGVDGLADLLIRICDQLFDYGFRRFAILNGHGGNNASINIAGMHLYKKGAQLANLNWWLIAGQLDPMWKGGHGGGEETAGVMAVDTSLINYEYINEGENIHNDLSDELPSSSWTNVDYKGATVQFPRLVCDITSNGWLVHGMGYDAPSRATPEWGREMISATADYIVDFLDAFSRAALPNEKKHLI